MFSALTAWLEALPFSVVIAEDPWLFPLLESVHVLALAIVFGSIAMVDLRLLNVTLKGRTVGELSSEVLPWTWISFVVAAITGSLMFISAATRYLDLWVFQLKMVLLACAGLNMLIFNLGAHKSIAVWGGSGATPTAARVAGGTSLFLWVAIIVAGRWIGFI